ncbi:MAG: TonB-dependent receptor [Candidatus Eremiobacteraeota bacterium]|nr:TonB-dependent receptor [Candidatus Eremiobacteraeota bacterium]
MRLLKSILVAAMVATLPVPGPAGTTGGITGRVVEARSNAPIQGVFVTATSPSQSARSVTDATGTFRFLSLAPDTYTLSFSKDGFDPVTQPGLTVVADQVQTYNASLVRALRTIARVTAQSAAALVKPGQTSDVYSINAAGQQARQGVAGPGSLNNAYGAIATVPGVQLDPGEVGWWQTLHVRGGDIDQVGYEFDGIPTNRAYDNAPQTMLSTLGSQEVQVYTGGVPASSDAQGISGYVNQVVKTGTSPGYADVNLGVGYPTFYHQASVEAGGSTPDRLFSYYVGIGGSDQAFRYVNNNNGSNIPNSFFYPTSAVPGYTCGTSTCSALPYSNGYVYTGAPSPVLFTTGLGFSLATQSLRDTLLNFHFGIPQHNGLRDDVQALFMTSENLNQYYSSIDDFGANTLFALYGPLTWDDSYQYKGAPFQPFRPQDVYKYMFPSSPPHAFQGLLPDNIRDPNDNGVAIEKLQYQHEFSPSSYLRAYGYVEYSNWDINGYNSDAQPYYGWELPYFLPDHTHGFALSYVNQLNDQHLLSVTGSYTYSNMQRYFVTFFPSDWNVTSYVGKNGKCYDPSTGDQIGCYDQTQGTLTNPEPPVTYSCKTSPKLPACAPGINPQWLVTDTFEQGNQGLNQVAAALSGYSVNDQWRPDDKLDVNLGLRIENFTYDFGDTSPDNPARQFWFNAYNAEFCFAPGVNNNKPIDRTNSGIGACPVVGGVQTVPLANSPYGPLVNSSGGSYATARFQPRLGLTYTVDPGDVLRGSFGVYARPPNSSWVQYNTIDENLPAFLGNHFYGYGFNTPDHLIRPDTSYNYDLSWEHRVKGTDWSFKLSPFFRATRDQLQNFYIDPQGGLESGLNVGSQQSSGVEFALQKGDLSRDGLSGQLSFTYIHSQIRYQNFTNTNQNVIDQLNGYILAYDAFLKGHGGFPCYFYESSGGAGTTNCKQRGVVANPYYNQPYQNPLSPMAWYTTYDVIPGPAAAANGYAVPYVATLLLNYKHQRLTVTNFWNFNSGASYGAPTAWPGFNPQSCYAPPAAWLAAHGRAADPASCDDFGTLPLFIPDPYTNGYDNLGAFKEPWQLQMGFNFNYEVSPRITARLNFSNLLDICGQRGYQWDNPSVCVYGSLPTNFLYPAGNFYPNSVSSRPPPQLQYPYSFWFNGNNTGFLGVVQPLQVTGSVTFKL